MLQFTHQQQLYQLPLLANTTENKLMLDQGSLQLGLFFSVPESAIPVLYESTPLLQTNESPLLDLELAINYCRYDFSKKLLVPIGNLEEPLQVKNLQNKTLSSTILANSTLYLLGYAQPCILQRIQFGALQENRLTIAYEARALDVNGPFSFMVEVEGISLQHVS
ncbi:MAG: hypothetical protein ACRBFS_23220 [Aureispira sp.]